MSNGHTNEPWNNPVDNPQVDLLNLLQGINTSSEKNAASLAQLVVIEQARLDAEIKHMTIDDALLQQILDAGNAALLAESGDVTAMAAKDATIASLQAQLAPNPALAASAAAFLSNALAANPPANPVVPVTPATPPAAPALYDPTIAYVAGNTVSDKSGNIWTDVQAPIGDAPGVTAGNWTLTTPAPAPAPATS
jgi:hypothetical protein